MQLYSGHRAYYVLLVKKKKSWHVTVLQYRTQSLNFSSCTIKFYLVYSIMRHPVLSKIAEWIIMWWNWNDHIQKHCTKSYIEVAVYLFTQRPRHLQELSGGPPSEANSFSANQEILHVSWNPRFITILTTASPLSLS